MGLVAKSAGPVPILVPSLSNGLLYTQFGMATPSPVKCHGYLINLYQQTRWLSLPAWQKSLTIDYCGPAICLTLWFPCHLGTKRRIGVNELGQQFFRKPFITQMNTERNLSPLLKLVAAQQSIWTILQYGDMPIFIQNSWSGTNFADEESPDMRSSAVIFSLH